MRRNECIESGFTDSNYKLLYTFMFMLKLKLFKLKLNVLILEGKLLNCNHGTFVVCFTFMSRLSVALHLAIYMT